MKRKLILLAVTIVFLAGFGALLHSPPSMIDAVTGEQHRSQKRRLKPPHSWKALMFSVLI